MTIIFNKIFFFQQLLTEIKKVNLTVDNKPLYFDENGDPNRGYDILYWNMTGATDGANIIQIGQYWPGEKIKFPQDLLRKRINMTVRIYFLYIYIYIDR